MKNIEKVAQIIKLLVLDVDGVMTDGSIYLDAEQELFKSFNAKDGMGISCAIRCGLQVAIITGRCSPIIRRRARELGIDPRAVKYPFLSAAFLKIRRRHLQ